ncbi:MAG: CoA-transferase [Sulfolobales archaeon]
MNALKEVELKLMDLPDAVRRFIVDGSHIAMAGFAITRNAMAIAHEIIRHGRRGLIVSESIGDMALDLMVGAGVVKEVNYGGGSLDRLGRIDCVNRAIVEKRIRVNEYSNFSMVSKFLGGALGLTFMPTKSMIESDMFKILKDRGEATEIVCPFTGEKYIALKTLRPDVAIIHAQAADTDGNIYIHGPKFDIKEVAFASNRVVVTVEEVVPKDRISHDLIYIPSYRVDAIVPRPFGAYPTNLYGYYYHDEEHIRSYARTQCEDEPFRKYLEDHVLGVDSFDEFLRKTVSPEKMLRLIYLAKTLV